MAEPIEQLEAMRRLGEDWDGYGAAAPQAKIIDLAREFIGLLVAMLARSSAAPTEMHVSPTRVGGILIDWEADAIEHEMELSPDGSIGFLHHNKKTGGIATRKFSASDRAVDDHADRKRLSLFSVSCLKDRELATEAAPGYWRPFPGSG
jgi:hypothetical protein